MADRDFLYFHKLKVHIVKKLRQQYPEVGPDISLWKGREIEQFQLDLEKNVQGRISEKWFYTHLKSNSKNLPRIDILDLLSQYVGFENWMEFKLANTAARKQIKPLIIGLTLLVLGVVVAYFYVFEMGYHAYEIKIVDAYSNTVIDTDKMVVSQLFTDQSPRKIECEENGEYVLITNKDQIEFVIEAPFYKTDTIRRATSQFSGLEQVRLYPNDFELIFHHLTNNDGHGWQRRRAQLSDMIADQAVIMQLSEDLHFVLELYDKAQWINKLTIPTGSLSKIEIVDIQYKDDRITSLRFIQTKGGAK